MKRFTVVRLYDMNKFMDKIQALLKDGWELHGNMLYEMWKDSADGHVVHGETFVQALTMEDFQ